MKPVFEIIRQLAKPFLNTRHNDVHTAISTRLAFRLHEVEGVKIANEILQGIYNDADKAEEILGIIDGHDSRQKPVSLNDLIVKDADKLWRYSSSGFHIDIERFGESYEQGLERLRTNISGWFFKETAKEIAAEKLSRREKEKG